jgi:hypothetical protein
MAVDPVDGLEVLELQLQSIDLLNKNSGNRKFRPTSRAQSTWTLSSETTDLLKENSGNRKFRPRNHRSFERKLWEQEISAQKPQIFWKKTLRTRRAGPGRRETRAPSRTDGRSEFIYKTQVTFKTVPLVPRAQKLFRISITHFYFFTYRVLSPESRPIQVSSPNTQASKTRTIKKPGPGRAAPRCVEPRE